MGGMRESTTRASGDTPSSLANKPWFVAGASQAVVTKAMAHAPAGDYVVRESAQNPGAFVLMVKLTAVTGIQKRIVWDQGVYRIDGGMETYESINDLLSSEPMAQRPAKDLVLGSSQPFSVGGAGKHESGRKLLEQAMDLAEAGQIAHALQLIQSAAQVGVLKHDARVTVEYVQSFMPAPGDATKGNGSNDSESDFTGFSDVNPNTITASPTLKDCTKLNPAHLAPPQTENTKRIVKASRVWRNHQTTAITESKLKQAAHQGGDTGMTALVLPIDGYPVLRTADGGVVKEMVEVPDVCYICNFKEDKECWFKEKSMAQTFFTKTLFPLDVDGANVVCEHASYKGTGTVIAAVLHRDAQGRVYNRWADSNGVDMYSLVQRFSGCTEHASIVETLAAAKAAQATVRGQIAKKGGEHHQTVQALMKTLQRGAANAALAAVVDAIGGGNANNVPSTGDVVKLISGVKDVVDATDYSNGLSKGTFAQPTKPTALELQAVIDAVNAAVEAVTKCIANDNADGVPATANEINLLSGVSGAVDGRDYAPALAKGIFADPSKATAAEIQTVVDAANAETASDLNDAVTGGTDGTAPTSEDINKFVGVAGAVGGTHYGHGLAKGAFADPKKPTAEEVQAVVVAVNAAVSSVVDAIKDSPGGKAPTRDELNLVTGGDNAAAGIVYSAGLANGKFADPGKPTAAEVQAVVGKVNALQAANGDLKVNALQAANGDLKTALWRMLHHTASLLEKGGKEATGSSSKSVLQTVATELAAAVNAGLPEDAASRVISAQDQAILLLELAEVGSLTTTSAQDVTGLLEGGYTGVSLDLAGRNHTVEVFGAAKSGSPHADKIDGVYYRVDNHPTLTIARLPQYRKRNSNVWLWKTASGRWAISDVQHKRSADTAEFYCFTAGWASDDPMGAFTSAPAATTETGASALPQIGREWTFDLNPQSRQSRKDAMAKLKECESEVVRELEEIKKQASLYSSDEMLIQTVKEKLMERQQDLETRQTELEQQMQIYGEQLRFAKLEAIEEHSDAPLIRTSRSAPNAQLPEEMYTLRLKPNASDSPVDVPFAALIVSVVSKIRFPLGSKVVVHSDSTAPQNLSSRAINSHSCARLPAAGTVVGVDEDGHVLARLDNCTGQKVMTLTRWNHTLAPNFRDYRRGDLLATIGTDGNWVCVEVVGQKLPNSSTYTVLPQATTTSNHPSVATFSVDLNDLNHYVAHLTTAGYTEHAQRYMQAVEADSSEVYDGITGNLLETKNQLVKIGLTSKSQGAILVSGGQTHPSINGQYSERDELENGFPSYEMEDELGLGGTRLLHWINDAENHVGEWIIKGEDGYRLARAIGPGVLGPEGIDADAWETCDVPWESLPSIDADAWAEALETRETCDVHDESNMARTLGLLRWERLQITRSGSSGSTKSAATYTAVEDVRDLVTMVTETRGNDRQHGWQVPQMLLLVADAGTGKTFFTTQMLNLAAGNERFYAPGGYLPIVISLQAIVFFKGQKGSAAKLCDYADDYIEWYIDASYSTDAGTRLVLLDAYRSHRLLVIFDGLDEAPSIQDDLTNFVCTVLCAGGHHVVLTSRPGIDGLKERLRDSGFTEFDLAPLTEQQQRIALRRQLPGKAGKFVANLIAFQESQTALDAEYFGKVAKVDRLEIELWPSMGNENRDEQPADGTLQLKKDGSSLVTSPDELLEAAEFAAPTAKAALEEVAAELGIPVVRTKEELQGALASAMCALTTGPLKGKERIIAKSKKYTSFLGPDFAWILDVYRVSFLCKNAEQMLQVVRLLGKHASLTVTRIKNLFTNLDPTHFRRFMCSVRVDLDAGRYHIIEVQIHLFFIFKYKTEHKDQMHGPYEYFRSLFQGGAEKAALMGGSGEGDDDGWMGGMQKRLVAWSTFLQTPVMLAVLVRVLCGLNFSQPKLDDLPLRKAELFAMASRRICQDSARELAKIPLLQGMVAALPKGEEKGPVGMEEMITGLLESALQKASVANQFSVGTGGDAWEVRRQFTLKDVVDAISSGGENARALAEAQLVSHLAVEGDPRNAYRVPTQKVLESGNAGDYSGFALQSVHLSLQETMSAQVLAASQAAFDQVVRRPAEARRFLLDPRLENLRSLCSTRVYDRLGVAFGAVGGDLNFPGESLDADGGDAVAVLLEKGQAITGVTLKRSRMGSDAINAITKALETNQSVTELNLAHVFQGTNDINEQNGRAVATMITTNSTIRTLNLAGNRMGAGAGIAIAIALETNQSIDNIDLSENLLSSGDKHRGTGACLFREAWAKTLQTNSKIMCLNLERNGLDSATQTAIETAWNNRSDGLCVVEQTEHVPFIGTRLIPQHSVHMYARRNAYDAKSVLTESYGYGHQ